MRRSVIAIIAALTTAVVAVPSAGGDSGTGTLDAAAPPTPAELPAPSVRCSTIVDHTGTPYNFCDHGPDLPADAPAPGTAAAAPAPAAPALAPQQTNGIKCYGDGTTGLRVQAVYAYAPGRGKNQSIIDSIPGYAAQVESEVAASAQQTGGERHVRWVTDGDCNLDIAQVALPSAASDTPDAAGTFFVSTITDMLNLGYKRTDRVYLIWYDTVDTTHGCGIANLGNDDRGSSLNVNSYGPRFTRVDRQCFGIAETHELGHNLGAVQHTAPHHTNYGHCTDEFDIMCYPDGQGTTVDLTTNTGPTGACQGTPDLTEGVPGGGTGNNRRYDCNHDDYFSTNPTGNNYLVTHWNIANSPVFAQSDSTGTEGAGAYHSLSRPVRIVDSRQADSGSIWSPRLPLDPLYPTHPSLINPVKPARLTPGAHYVTKVTGFDAASGTANFGQQPYVSDAGVPNVGVSAVVLNVTVVDPTSAGFLSVRPYDYDTFLTTPTVSNINYTTDQVIPNQVTITVPPNGLVDLYTSAGSPYVLFDVAGWFADSSGAFGGKGSYHPLTPSRIMNTRATGPMTPNSTATLKVTGGSVDASFAGAVVLNVTAAETTGSGYFTVWPTGQPRPNASNVNFAANGASANLVIAGVGADGSVNIYSETNTANVIVDLLGWFDNGTGGAPPGATFVPVTPARVVDTRSANPPQLSSNQTASYLLRAGGVPNQAAVTAVVANVAAVSPTGAGYLSVFPAGTAAPDTSTVNFVANQNRANLAFVTLNGAGQASVFNFGGNTHVLVDVAGYFTT